MLASTQFTSVVIAQCDDVTFESLTNPGPFEVQTLNQSDGIRNGPDYFGATIYYPTNANPPFASIAIVPGFTAQPSSVENWGPFYASHGIVTIIIGTNNIFDFPEARAYALLDALETIRYENTRETSPLEGALNLAQLAVSGHSMGGGGAQRAAVLDSSIAGVVALCPFLINTNLNHGSPVLIFSGQNDPTAPPSTQADIHYNSTPEETDKLLFEIENGYHSVANSPTGGNGVTGKIALSWIKLYVEKNDCYCPLLTENLLLNPTEASKVEVSFECELLGLTTTEIPVEVYPNPTNNLLNLNVTGDLQYELISPLGQRIIKGLLYGNNKQIDLSRLPAGMYYLKAKNQLIKIIKYN
tara:strand:+ start:2822 stop:3889 length:1068 start_codon:yes stop_codon:yes gene_type:complete